MHEYSAAAGGKIWFQSAPGTRAGRCLRASGVAGLNESVSIRARHACRAMRQGRRHQAAHQRVSIRARHACRAMPRTEDLAAELGLFQSAPGTRAGRCWSRGARSAGRRGFNPRPARVPGDAWTGEEANAFRAVSIRARHACRAMREVRIGLFSTNAVSIRARHACRAMLAGRLQRQCLVEVSIRARHACRAMPVPTSMRN